MIDLNRPPEPGDMVRATVLDNLMPKTVFGKVIQKTGFAARLHLYACFGDAGRKLSDPPEYIEVEIAKVRVQADPYEVLRFCTRQFKLIRDQDQGAGGNVSPTECWRSAQRLASEAINILGAISDEVGQRGDI